MIQIYRIMILVSLPLLLCADALISRTQMHMGTMVTISLPKAAYEKSQSGFELIHDIEMVLSSYKRNAEVYRLNHGETLRASAWLQEALMFCRRYYVESDGYFDITVGSITKEAFRFGEAEKIPTDSELDQSRLNINGIVHKGHIIHLLPGITLDLGGMGKGYAVDKVAELYREENLSEGIIKASGDIRCLGQCSVEIQHPFKEGSFGSFTTRYNDMGITTSGNYRRYVSDKGNNHLIDPKQKRSQQRFASITLVGRLPSSDLDAYATAASVMPYEKAVAFLKARQVGYILITTDKEVIVSDTLEDLVVDFTWQM